MLAAAAAAAAAAHVYAYSSEHKVVPITADPNGSCRELWDVFGLAKRTGVVRF